MQITAATVKELRELTGAGMMDCKKALMESNGDVQAAVERMRKFGQIKADKRSGRITTEGMIAIAASNAGTQAVIVEVNCETDFVAKDEQFQMFSRQLPDVVLVSGVNTVGELSAATMESGQSVEQARLGLISKIGENVQIRRFERLEIKGVAVSYSHGNRIGALVDILGGNKELGKDIAMHIAASNPVCIAVENVPADLLAKEKEIFTAQAETSGKPPQIITKIVQGKLKKRLQEITLLGQSFVKDTELAVGDLLKNADAKVAGFVRFEVGEGIEKTSENFADEVRKQVDQSADKGDGESGDK